MTEPLLKLKGVGSWLIFLLISYVTLVVTFTISTWLFGEGFAVRLVSSWFAIYNWFITATVGFLVTRYLVSERLRLFACGIICGITIVLLYLPHTAKLPGPEYFRTWAIVSFLRWAFIGTVAWYVSQEVVAMIQERWDQRRSRPATRSTRSWD
jgi:hypothetical protein